MIWDLAAAVAAIVGPVVAAGSDSDHGLIVGKMAATEASIDCSGDPVCSFGCTR